MTNAALPSSVPTSTAMPPTEVPLPVALHAEVSGEGHPLVLLHGLFGSLSNWRPLARVWSAQYRVLNVDQRNHGKSPHAEEFTYEALAADLRALLDLQGVTAAYVLGHSLGGKAAMQFALRYPALVDKLVVVDMPPVATPPRHETILAALNGADLTAARDRRALDAQLAPLIPESGVRQFLLMNAANAPEGGLQWRLNLNALTRQYPQVLRGLTLQAGQAPFDKPTLFVRGANSDYIRDADWTATQALFPQAQLATIAGAGHWVQVEAPQQFERLVTEFLRA